MLLRRFYVQENEKGMLVTVIFRRKKNLTQYSSCAENERKPQVED